MNRRHCNRLGRERTRRAYPEEATFRRSWAALLPGGRGRRARLSRILWLALPGLLAGGAASAGETNTGSETETKPAVTQAAEPSGGADFSSFRLISERNIFNANRSSRSASPPPERRREPVVETLSLVGILSHGDRLVAFFDGSSSSYRKTCRPGETIAGYQVVAIGLNEVTLEAQGQTVTLAVGNQMRREDEGPWQVTGAFQVTESSNRFPETTPGGGRVTANADPGGSNGEAAAGRSGGDESDVLRRLREKRAQEMKNE